MTTLSLRELDRHLEADIPFIFPHEIEDELYDWEDFCAEATYEEDHGWYDDYDPFYYDPYPMDDDFY